MKYDAKKLQEFSANVMQAAGLRASDAEIFSEALIYADMRGIGSHGISRLRTYAKRVVTGVINQEAVPVVLRDSATALLIDGKNGIGASIAKQSLDMCIERARKHGSCCAAVRNGVHFGTGAFYTEYAAGKGMVCFMVSNSEAAVVPTGGAVPMLGTNPLSIGVPAGRRDPFVLDMATSIVARGKVVLAKKEGKGIPGDWGVDKQGTPTDDPDAILNGGAMLPFGGPKGYGISLAIDLICSCLGGALNSRETPGFWDDFEHPQNVGYFMIVLDAEKFLPLEEFTAKVDAMLGEFKACPTAPGVKEVMIPGEIEANKYRGCMASGVKLSAAVVEDLKGVGKEYGISVDIF